MRLAFWAFVANFWILLYVGSQHVEEPFITIGALSTAFYFSWFLIIIPVIGIVENTLLDIATEPKS
jgi:ubiquinol-cytochrome c reductase cytochrome b subunit